MATISQALTTGVKQIINDSSSIAYSENANLTLDYKTYNGYKLLKNWLRVKGVVRIELPNTTSVERDIEIIYKSDYIYRLLQNFVFKLNTNIEVRNLVNMAFYRFYEIMENIGNKSLENIPTKVKMPPQESTLNVPFEFFIPQWFIMPDMINSTQTFIYTELYSSIQSTFTAIPYANIIKEVRVDNAINTTSKIFIPNGNIDSVSCYWIMENGYLEGGDVNEIMAKMGALFKVAEKTQAFTSSGANQYIRLMPTTQLILKDLVIVCRDSETGQRVDNIMTRIEIRNGDRPLLNVEPNIIRQQMIDKYNLSWEMFNEKDDKEKDKQGCLYGVLRVDTNYFGDLENALLATGNWNEPYLYFDLDREAMEALQGSLLVEIYLSSVEVPSVLQSLANSKVRNYNGS